MALPKTSRIKNAREFSEIFSRARPINTDHFALRILRNKSETSKRFAVVVPKKIIASAVERNRIRRQVSEMIRTILLQHEISSGISVVCTVKSAPTTDHVSLKRELMSLLKKSGILIS